LVFAGRVFVGLYAGSMNALIPVFPYPCGKFGKGQLGTDFGKADALRAVSAIGFAAVSLWVRLRESVGCFSRHSKQEGGGQRQHQPPSVH
jgi:hypothetical protein